MTDDERIEMLLTRAAHVTPTRSRPADDVLRRADQRPFGRLRRHLRELIGGLVACGLVAGGAVAVSSGDRPAPAPAPPPPVRLTIDLPPGWHYDDSGLALTCASNLTPRTVYRGATIGDLRCPGGEGPTMSGPVLVAGQLDGLLAERVRTSGSPTTVGDRAAWVEQGGDAPYGFATYLVAGTEDVGFVVVAPHGTGPEEPVVPSLQGEDVWSVPVEALMAASRVGVRGGERVSQHKLPDDVRAVVLTIEPRNVDAAPGALVWTQENARQVLRELRPAKRSLPPCGEPSRARTLWLQRPTGSWVRVDVTTDAAGCRSAVSELGGSARLAHDPVAAARRLDEGETRSELSADAESFTVGDVTFTVPDGWQVVRDTDFDPCTATMPTVVLAESLAPTCLVDVGQRAYQPYLWMTKQPLEDRRFRTNGDVPLVGRSRPVRGLDGTTLNWSKEMLVIDGTMFQGWLGRPADGGSGRLLLMGVPWQAGATRLQKLAGSS
jgi:hypothetical protein